MQRFITTWTLPITFRSADPHFRTAIEALLTGIEPESLSEAIRQVCYVLEAVEVTEHLRSSHDEARMGNETYKEPSATYGFKRTTISLIAITRLFVRPLSSS